LILSSVSISAENLFIFLTIANFQLIEFSNLKRLNLEILENLEGNRVVENSKKIRMVSTDFHGISIDTPQDLLKAEKFISLND